MSTFLLAEAVGELGVGRDFILNSLFLKGFVAMLA